MDDFREFRWVVSWTGPISRSDWDLMNSHREYFLNESDAISFAESKNVKGKPFYWQPHVWKEERIKVTTFEWRLAE